MRREEAVTIPTEREAVPTRKEWKTPDPFPGEEKGDEQSASACEIVDEKERKTLKRKTPTKRERTFPSPTETKRVREERKEETVKETEGGTEEHKKEREGPTALPRKVSPYAYPNPPSRLHSLVEKRKGA